MNFAASAAQIRPLIITVHSLFGHPQQFLPLNVCVQARMRCSVWHFRYNTKNDDLTTTAQALAELIKEVRGYSDFAPVHFVTHGAGAIVLRRAFKLVHFDTPKSRVVMIAPCNKGSMLARQIRDRGLRSWCPTSPILDEMAEFSPATADQLIGPLPASCAPLVIAGTAGFNPLLGMYQHDGRVLVSETHLQRTHMHVKVWCTHNMLLYHPVVLRHASCFIKHGMI